MNSLIIFCLVGLSCGVLAELHEDLYDLVDIKEIIDNEEMTKTAYACLMDLGPCTVYYQILRDKLPHILRSICKTCSPEHKAKYLAYMEQFKREHINEFNEMVKKYGQ